MYFYSDTKDPDAQPFKGGGRIDPTRMVLKHMANQFFLELITKSDESTLVDKFQAEKELVICKRKQEFWKRKHGFEDVIYEQELALLKKKWNRTDP